MLKITNVETAGGQRLKVEGKLAQPWVSELESAWNEARQTGRTRGIVVDLTCLTFIDPEGEAVLAAMIAEGARLIATGIYSEYVVEQLTRRAHKAEAPPRVGNGAAVRQSSSTSESSQELQRSPTKETH
jgi:hypothetical protein